MQVNNVGILVTGATGGIGEALCIQLAEAGARLVINSVQQHKLQALQARLGPQHVAVAADISTEAGRQKIADTCEQRGVSGVINLAGIMNFALFEDQESALIERLLQVNTAAPILLTRALLPQLLLKPQARVVNVGSIFASIGHPGFAVYCASKAALKTFSEALSRELANTSVSVAYIAPRATRTALNSDRVVALNEALGNKSDAPELVATAVIELFAGTATQRFLGWPERLFVKINALLPALVQQSLVKKLPIIQKYARHQENTNES